MYNDHKIRHNALTKIMRNDIDWHKDFINASEQRYIIAKGGKYTSQYAWLQALNKLKESRTAIYYDSAEGELLGLPEGLSGFIVATLLKIAQGNEIVDVECINDIKDTKVKGIV